MRHNAYDYYIKSSDANVHLIPSKITGILVLLTKSYWEMQQSRSNYFKIFKQFPPIKTPTQIMTGFAKTFASFNRYICNIFPVTHPSISHKRSLQLGVSLETDKIEVVKIKWNFIWPDCQYKQSHTIISTKWSALKIMWAREENVTFVITNFVNKDPVM